MKNNHSLSTKDASRYLNISESALRQSRMNGRRDGHIPPPPFVRVGRKIIYRQVDLDNWLEAHLVVKTHFNQRGLK